MPNRIQPPWLNKLMVQSARQLALKHTAFHTCLQLGILPKGKLFAPYLGLDFGETNTAAVTHWILEYYEPMPGSAYLPDISQCAEDLERVLRDRLPENMQGGMWHG